MKMRVGVALLLAVFLVLGAGVAMAKNGKQVTTPQATIGAEDVTGSLGTARDPHGYLVEKGANLLTYANNMLAEDNVDEAVRALNQIPMLGMPAGAEADKLVADSYLALGGVYAELPNAAVKAVGYYELALERLDVVADAEIAINTLHAVADIYTAAGQLDDAARVVELIDEVEFGIAVKPLQVLPVMNVLPSGTDGPGDDTCDAAITIGDIPYSEIMSISPAGDHNWRTFTLAGESTVRIETLSEDTIGDDTDLTLWGDCPNTALIAFDDDGGPGFLSLIELTLPAGTYWLEVGGWFDVATPTDFELLITEIVLPEPDQYEPDDELGEATKIGFRNNGSGEGNQTGRDNKNIQDHSVFPAADIDWVKWSLSRANLVRFETFGDENPDTIIGMSTGGGLLLAVNDDKGLGEFSSKIEVCLGEGDYYGIVLPFFSTDTFDYSVAADVEAPCLFESEPNGQPATAQQVEFGEVWSGFHLPGGLTFEDDFYTFTLDEPAFVSMASFGYDIFNVDTRFLLFDGALNLLAVDDDGGDGFLSRIDIFLDAGTYYLDVTASTFAGGAVFPYSFDITVSDPPILEVEPNDDCASAQAVDLGDNVLASINPGGDLDNYSLTLAGDALVTITTSGPTGDTVLKVSDSTGATLYCCDDDGGSGLFSSVSYCLPAGTYCVTAKAFGATSVISEYNIEFSDGGTCTAGDPLDCPVAGLGCPF